MLTKAVSNSPLELKAANDGSFEGYASIFGEVDSYNEATDRGSFADSLTRIKASGRRLPFLWQHDTTSPIGTFTDMAEDTRGLHVKGKMILTVRKAQEAKALIEDGAVTGLSIGYNVKADRFDKLTGVRHLTNIDLREISAVTWPAVENARITSIKSLSVGELSEALRHGRLGPLSKRDTERLVAAWRAMEDEKADEPNPSELAALAAQMKDFTQFLRGK